MNEWPLLVFTLLVQASVGMVLMGALAGGWLRRVLTAEQHFTALRPLLLLAPVLAALGLLASVAHLGYPLNAFHALRHVASSWLSREILLASLYLGIVGLAALLALLTRRVSLLLLLLGGLVGLADVGCMAGIYINSAVITWMHLNTAVMFYGTVISLGVMLGAAVLCRGPVSPELMQRLLLTALLGCIVAAAAHWLVTPGYLRFLAQAGAAQPVMLPFDAVAAFLRTAPLRVASAALLMGAIVLLVLLLGPARQRVGMIQRGGLLAAALLVLLAQIGSRYAFFTLH
ncbi:dimethyl sulfoxide reductase [Chimaeribacter coloradensis]|uniref:Dimethyl sulfoxide reductase n=1 Tax=Chimaeribacter coloradensis TaxID=2060068 RepID=A0A2N5E373_9GAMM|nr:DmsC/YnfH family molybdoenzyme membrane anchor subunit [Chimaeribacter coloradensis]PLR35153.1 dimethyl sulfoxide reductase [Chimaeribacter coloradensis]